MAKAMLYKTDGTTEELKPKGPKGVFTLEQLQAAVDGYIEIVQCRNMPGHVAVVNEEGRIFGLPPNYPASQVVGQPVVGNVLIAPRKMID